MSVRDSELLTGAISRSLPARIISKTGGGILRILLVAIGLVWLVPTFGLLVESLRGAQYYTAGGWWNALIHPEQLTWSNYSSLWGSPGIQTSFFNTIKITLPATILVVLISAAAAYAFAWIDFPGRDWIFLIVVALIVVPIQIALIPVVRLYNAIGIQGTIYAVILFHVAFGLPFAIFLLRNYFIGIPRDLLEAARMDGASEARIFTRVILPLGLPAIASLSIFQFLWVWNDLLVALVFSNQDSQPLTVALSTQTRQFGTSIDILAPGAFLSLIVPLIVFLAFQRFFVQGTLAGSVK